jgi:hypothetical protein
MTDRDKLEMLEQDTAPRNADEFFMGMYLALLLDVIDNFDEEDEDQLRKIVDEAAKALVYWRNKYHEDILTAGGNNEQNNNGYGQ